MTIAATGSYVPDQVVTNEDLAALGCDSDWIVQRTGIHQRRKARNDQASSDLAYEAALRCLASAGVKPSEVDLVICATMTPDHITPSTACLLQKRLGCIAPAFDVSAACSGFMYALVTGAQFVRSGSTRNALIVGCEVMSHTVNTQDIKTYPLFGDGAGAALLQPCSSVQTETTGLISFTFEVGRTFQPNPSSIAPTCELVGKANLKFIDEIVRRAEDGTLPPRPDADR